MPRSGRKIGKIGGGIEMCENKYFSQRFKSCPISKRMHTATQGVAFDNYRV